MLRQAFDREPQKPQAYGIDLYKLAIKPNLYHQSVLLGAFICLYVIYLALPTGTYKVPSEAAAATPSGTIEYTVLL